MKLSPGGKEGSIVFERRKKEKVGHGRGRKFQKNDGKGCIPEQERKGTRKSSTSLA